jgi:hypothetical protein
MIDVYNISMSTGNITMTSSVESKVINNIDISLHSFIQGCEQGSILIHMMSASTIYYPFILREKTKKHLRSSELEGEIITRSMNSRHVSFKSLDLLDPIGYWWPLTYSNWILLTVFSSACSSVLLCNCGFYTSGVV